MQVLILQEGVNDNHLYHYTSFAGLIGILDSNKMLGNTETSGFLKGKTTVSFSRMGAGHNVYERLCDSPEMVKIVVDKSKLKLKGYNPIPYEYADALNRNIV